METKHNYNIIGDIHGRKGWKELVKDNCINICVGDYLDPYEWMSYEDLLQNFRDIIAYKQAHPETVLLYGNHDMHYICDIERSSRYDWSHVVQNKQLFEDAKPLFHGIAYAINDEVLVTHAGVTKEWYEKNFGEYHGEPLSEVAEKINNLWQHNIQEFAFTTNATSYSDTYGESPTHSPVWIRPWVLAEHNLFAGTSIKQVFGHTQMEDITTVSDNLICIDCLGTKVKSYNMVNR